MPAARISLLILIALGSACPMGYADAISPSIKETDQQYSSEKPDRAFYGTGIAGRMSEASALRFRGEQETQDGDIDLAIRQLAKAVQLDQGDPEGHLLYARALSKKIHIGKNVSPQQVQDAIAEWKLLWHHDADHGEQFEARGETKKLIKLAKQLDKRGISNDRQVASK